MNTNQTVELTKDDFLMYLQIYNADIDWAPHLERLKQRAFKNDRSSGIAVMNQAACAILYPLQDKSVLSDPPERFLFGCPKFSQYESKNWLEEFKKVVRKDREIQVVRKQALSFGIVYPLEYVPRSRQAFHWLMDHAENSGTITECDPKVVKQKMEKLVYAYGGAAICNVFQKPEYGRKVKNLLNWRTGYFFEKLIHEVYKPDEILKIKSHDIEEVRRSKPELIKKVK